MQHVFDYHEHDVFACVADIGWITGHSYGVYGALANGATSVLFESTPTYPDPGNEQNEEQSSINQNKWSTDNTVHNVYVHILNFVT